MTKEEIYGHIDHTLLKPTSTWDMIQQICEESIQYKTASICIPPAFVKRVHDKYGDQINICTVIGFPLGYNTTEVKVFEAKKAIEEGAGEIDMVINIGDAKDHNFQAIEDEIKALRAACDGKVLKVIIETCYLTDEEKIAICKCVTNAKADYIKTSTGFGTAGATVPDVELFKKHIGPDVKIKAAGGMKTKEDIYAFMDAGADRLGTSSGIKLLNS
ncbi:deoxyribose-phosphate aldolase [Lawsonibacter celer]|uniref:deoxyribose-phosphate aldolase n=1 Tax=Lawsonibacter celer TaxID=2986526 RepID=UPI00164618F4|nr:deoxyribose-phosphate aldolase [Lawsonibacter celer]